MSAPPTQPPPTHALAPPRDPVALVLDLLGGAEQLKRSGDNWEARCPAHQDDHASLSIGTGGGGRAILNCHAGCSIHQVCSSLGIQLRDLYPTRGTSGTFRPVRAPTAPAAARIVRSGTPKAKAPLGKCVATYDYVDEEGSHLFQVMRFDPKTFRQRRRDPEGKNGWSWKLGNVRRVLYRLPKVLEAVRNGDTVFIVEGEKDVGNLEAIGLVATCSPGGASRNTLAPKWRPEHAEALAGAKRVVVIADKDDAGRAHAIAVASSLFGAVAELKVLELPGEKVKDASDWLAQGGTREQLEQLADAVPSWTPPPEGPQTPSGGDGDRHLPVIMLGDRQIRDVVLEGWSAIHAANSPPRVFWRAGLMARLVEGPTGVRIQEMAAVAIYGLLGRVATWKSLVRGEIVNVYPDGPVSKDMQDSPDRKLPELEAVVACPVFDANGELLAQPGYHPKAKLWLHLAEGFVVPPVPAKPTSEQVAAALGFILGEILVGFDFATQADRANAVAMLLGPPTRRLIPGQVPLFLNEAPVVASGKTLICDMVSIPATGQLCPVTTFTFDEDELRKRITALLMGARDLVLIDNLPQEEIGSSVLAAATTAKYWEDRVLGFLQMVQIPNRGCWLLTGNNPLLTEELARRCVRIRIDQKLDRPWLSNRVFKHEDLRAWATEHRAEFVHALLTLVSAWLAAGRPLATTRLGSFENWSRITGGILEVAGVQGFLGNADELYEQSDLKGREWREFVRAWWEIHHATQVKVSDLVSLIGRQNLLPTALKGKTFRARVSELGKSLRDVRGRRYDDLVVLGDTDAHANCTLYRLAEMKPSESLAAPVQQELAPHWSEPKSPDAGDMDRGDDPDAY